MPREDEFIHKPLRLRKRPLASDVADAIEQLVDYTMRTANGLPVAFTRAEVLDQLIRISLTDDDEAVIRITIGAKDALQEKWGNILHNSSTFQAGYKHYEKRSSLPVVPVTEFFFKVVFEDGRVADCLDAMSGLEIKQSLPNARQRFSVDDGDGGSELIETGQVAGIVVFPKNSHAMLLRAWLQRLASAGVGQVDRAVRSLSFARPDTTAVQDLRETATGIKPAMNKALPRPKKTT